MVKSSESGSSLNSDERQNKEEPSVAPTDEPAPRVDKRWTKRLVALAKFLILAVVLIWIGLQLQKSWGEIVQYEWRPRYAWLILSGAFYLLAFLPSATFWFLSLRWLGQKPSYWNAVKAFYYSQLGKYVPGKAMVVVIRSGMIAGPEVRPSIAAVGVFYETLTMMGSGAFIAAIVVLACFRQHLIYSCMALGVAVCSCVPLLPPVFVKILQLLRIGKNDPLVQESLKKLNYSCLFKGFGLMAALWLCFGLSLWAAICGLGITPQPLFYALPRYVAVVALAMAFGFAVPISPGGLGIREAVLAALLIPYFTTILAFPSNEACTIAPDSLATVVSLLQRITSIVAEVSIVALFSVVSIGRKLLTNKETKESTE